MSYDSKISLDIDTKDGKTIELEGQLPDASHIWVIMRVKQSRLRPRKFKLVFFSFIRGNDDHRVVELMGDADDR
jgi:hypothetical protein